MDVEVERPHVHHSTGHRWIDLVVPIAALFVSLVSILIAYHHGQVMKELVEQNERLVQANSLPHLNLSVGSMDRTDGTKQVILRVANGGVGPAEVRSVEVLFKGRAMHDITELLETCCGISGGELSLVNLTNRMIRPGELVEYLDINDSNGKDRSYSTGVEQFYRAVGTHQIATKLCYCSVFDECWTVERPGQRPQPVAQCTAPKVPYE